MLFLLLCLSCESTLHCKVEAMYFFSTIEFVCSTIMSLQSTTLTCALLTSCKSCIGATPCMMSCIISASINVESSAPLKKWRGVHTCKFVTTGIKEWCRIHNHNGKKREECIALPRRDTHQCLFCDGLSVYRFDRPFQADNQFFRVFLREKYRRKTRFLAVFDRFRTVPGHFCAKSALRGFLRECSKVRKSQSVSNRLTHTHTHIVCWWCKVETRMKKKRRWWCSSSFGVTSVNGSCLLRDRDTFLMCALHVHLFS